MILDCPFCKARFLISATVFSNGPRRVRCGRCAHSWEAETPNNMDVVMVPLVEADNPPPSQSSTAAQPETSTVPQSVSANGTRNEFTRYSVETDVYRHPYGDCIGWFSDS